MAWVAEPTDFCPFLGRGSYEEFISMSHHKNTQTIVPVTDKSSFLPGRQPADEAIATALMDGTVESLLVCVAS